jgi:hypothetical protein
VAVVPRVEVNGTKALEAALMRGAAQTLPLMAAAVEKSAVDLQARTQRNASGRPGPNVVTGDYRGSWRVENAGSGPAEVSRSVGTDRAQAWRLEAGFVGADSLGRVFDQPPFPHHLPAVDVIEPRFYAAMEKIAQQATKW